MFLSSGCALDHEPAGPAWPVRRCTAYSDGIRTHSTMYTMNCAARASRSESVEQAGLVPDAGQQGKSWSDALAAMDAFDREARDALGLALNDARDRHPKSVPLTRRVCSVESGVREDVAAEAELGRVP